MRCISISVGDGPGIVRTFEHFATSKQAKSPLGKLLIALTKETGWSSEYFIWAFFGKNACLNIDHPTFLHGLPLNIKEDREDLSVRGVERAVRAHIRDSQESLRSTIEDLKEKERKLERTLEHIDLDKARTSEGILTNE